MVEMSVIAEYYGTCPKCGMEHDSLESLKDFDCDCGERLEPTE